MTKWIDMISCVVMMLALCRASQVDSHPECGKWAAEGMFSSRLPKKILHTTLPVVFIQASVEEIQGSCWMDVILLVLQP
jgi:hypothetical protein